MFLVLTALAPLVIPQKAHAATVVEIITSGTTWTVPADWNNSDNTIEVIGGGGGGGNGGAGDGSNAGSGGGGGGGGGYAKATNVTLTPGSSVNIQIGSGGPAATAGGDTYFNRGVSATTTCSTSEPQSVCAKGGRGGTSGVNNGTAGTGGAGGSITDGIGSTKTAGGSGSDGGTFTSGHDYGSGGGGGGGAGGTSADGSSGTEAGTSTAAAPAGAGGAGGAGGTASGGSSGTAGTGGNLNGGDGGIGGNGSVWSTAGAGGGGGGGGANARNATAEAGDAGSGGNYGAGGGGGGGGGRGSGSAIDAGEGASGAQGVIVITYTPLEVPVTISGTLYQLDGVTQNTTAGRTISMRVGTSTPWVYSTTTIAGTGFWQIPVTSKDFGAGIPIHVWVDNDPAFSAFTFTKASSTARNIPGVDLYQNRVVVKHEGFIATSTTNADLAAYDFDDDSSIPFTAVAGGALTVFKSHELRVAPGTVFAPGGSVTLHGNASTTNPDGDFSVLTGARQDGVATSSIVTLGSNIFTLAGNWFASSTVIFSHSATTTFTSTSTQQKNIIASSTPFSALEFDGSGGSWTFGSTAATSTSHTMIKNGSVTAPSSKLTIGGNYTNNGTYTHNSGTTTFSGSSAQVLAGAMTGTSAFSHVEFRGAGTKTFGSNAASTTNFDIISGSGAVTAPSTNLTVGGDFVSAGTFTHNSGTVYMTGSSNTLVGNGTTFNNLIIDNAGAGTITTSSSNFSVSSALTIADSDTLSIGSNLFATSTSAGSITLNGTISGAGTFVVGHSGLPTSGSLASRVRFDASTANVTMPARTYGGNVEIYNSAAAARTVTMGAGTHTISGALTVLAQSTQNTTLNGATNNPTLIISGDVDYTGSGSGSEIIWTGTGPWTVSGNIDLTGGTFTASSTNLLTMDGTSKTLTSPSATYAGLTLSGTITLGSNATSSGNVSLTGTITAPNRMLVMTGTGATLIGGGNTLRSLLISSGNTTLSSSDITVGTTTISSGATLNINSGRLFTATSTVSLNGTLGGTGTTTLGDGTNPCSTITSGGTLTANIRVDATGGDCNLTARTYGGNLEIYSNSSSAGRTVTPGSGTHTVSGNLILNAANTQNMTLQGSSNNPTVNVTGNIDFIGGGSGTEIVTSGTNSWDTNSSLDISEGNFTASSAFLRIAGNFINSAGTFTHNSGTTTFDGTSAQTISGTATGTSAFNNIEFSGAGPKTFNTTSASTTNFFINSGSGAVTAPSGFLSIAGHYSNSATFTHNSGTTTISSTTALQNFGGTMTGSSAFNNLEIINNFATTTFTSAASTTGNFYVVTPNVHVAFKAGATTTLQNLIVNGQSTGNEVRLWSGTQDSLWNLHVPGTRSVLYTSVKDSDACSSSGNINAADGTNVNGGNNFCWDFNAPAPILDLVYYRWRADDGNEITASYYTAQNTPLSSGIYVGDRVRLRFSVANTGNASASNYLFRLEHASSTDSYTTWLPVALSDNGPHFMMDETGFYLDNASTTHSSGLSVPTGKNFTPGYAKSTSNQTNPQSLSTTQYTELEYAFRSTSSISVDTAYRFRLTHAGSTATFSYTTAPELTVSPRSKRPHGGGGSSPGESGGAGSQKGGGGSGGGGGAGGGEESGSGGQQGGGSPGGGGGDSG